MRLCSPVASALSSLSFSSLLSLNGLASVKRPVRQSTPQNILARTPSRTARARVTLGSQIFGQLLLPFAPVLQTASDLNARKVLASTAARISSRPKPICNRFCGFRIGVPLECRSSQRKHMGSADRVSDWASELMDVWRQHCSTGSRKPCGKTFVPSAASASSSFSSRTNGVARGASVSTHGGVRNASSSPDVSSHGSATQTVHTSIR